ncbi:Uncharacterised protein [Pseudomonas putida]|nr:hypothetical protein SAMN05216307_5025 [Pseudomonas putida]SMQ01714.1 hypothetical protein SAMN05216380_2581 [Pseudomonas putida]VEE39349.1 Uncharacterised protein [Pseudomonas putida]VTQ43905.1 Uncharacterised protein [Pseudomonas putida]
MDRLLLSHVSCDSFLKFRHIDLEAVHLINQHCLPCFQNVNSKWHCQFNIINTWNRRDFYRSQQQITPSNLIHQINKSFLTANQTKRQIHPL